MVLLIIMDSSCNKALGMNLKISSFLNSKQMIFLARLSKNAAPNIGKLTKAIDKRVTTGTSNFGACTKISHAMNIIDTHTPTVIPKFNVQRRIPVPDVKSVQVLFNPPMVGIMLLLNALVNTLLQ